MISLLQRINLKNQLMPFLFALALAGCTTLFGNNITNLLKNDANANSEYYLNKIEQAQNFDEQQTYKLLAARILVNENKIPQAEALLSELKDLNEQQLLDKSLIDAHIAAVKGENQLAENRLNRINLASLSSSQQVRYYEIVAHIAKNRNQVINAIKARIHIASLLTDAQRMQGNNDKIWALLRNANRNLINNAPTDRDATLEGWIALANTYNDYLNQPSLLGIALQNWKAAYPYHSANNFFPTELRGLFNFQQTQLNKIALLLPLSGNAQLIGNTIKQGFYDAKGDSPIQVTVIDTLSMPIEQIIEQVKQQEIDTIVGPLLKQNVDKLTHHPDLLQGMNVLTLNSTENSPAIDRVCYYGLAPEDEAESAANRIWKEGIRFPFIIVPQSDLGRRMASAFNRRWQQLSGTDANIKFYNNADDINFTLQSGLNSNIEALYIVATNNQLSEIKTVIDNSGINLRLFASSRSHSSNNGPEYRLSMDGLEFSDIPFFKNVDTDQYKQAISLTDGDYSLIRLYAMGADAWMLINKFNELRQLPGFNLNGLTGKLSAGPNCNVEREMTWYKYQNATIFVLSN